MAVTGKRLDYLVLTTCCCAFILFGYDQGILSGLISTEDFMEKFDNPSNGLLGTIVAIYDIGCTIGSLATIWLGDVLGRRHCIALGGLLVCIGTALQCSALTVPHMIVGRIITGLGCGINTTTVPVYQSEMSESSQRGKSVMTEVSFVIFGIAVSNWVDFGFVFGGTVHHSLAWRIPILLQVIFPIMTFVLLPFIPESPRWLASKARDDEVRSCLARLHGNGAASSDEHIKAQAKIIIDTARHEAEIADSWLDVFSMGEQQNLRRMLLGALTQIIQQFTCINGVVYYGPNILSQSLGMGPRLSAIVGGCGSVCFWVGSCCPIFFVEKRGRRPIMLYGLFTTCIALTGFMIATAFAENGSHTKNAGYGALACLLVYEFCYGASWAGIPWVYAPEINSLRMRNRGGAIASAAEWISAFIVVEITPSGIASLGWKYYLIWVSIMSVSWFFLYFCYPETAGASLEDMDLYFAAQKSWNVLEDRDIRAFLIEHGDDNAAPNEKEPSDCQIHKEDSPTFAHIV